MPDEPLNPQPDDEPASSPDESFDADTSPEDVASPEDSGAAQPDGVGEVVSPEEIEAALDELDAETAADAAADAAAAVTETAAAAAPTADEVTGDADAAPEAESVEAAAPTMDPVEAEMLAALEAAENEAAGSGAEPAAVEASPMPNPAPQPNATAPAGGATKSGNALSADELEAALEALESGAAPPPAAPTPAAPSASPSRKNAITADELEAAMSSMQSRQPAPSATTATGPTPVAVMPNSAGAASRPQPAPQPAPQPVAPPTPAPSPVANAVAFSAPELSRHADGDLGRIELLDDVELDVKIELGRTEMYIEDVLRLGVGSVVELDKLAGDPVDIYVNERLVARGEVLVLNDSFCVRINDILSPIPELEEK